jgi:hypothetical protein
VKRWNGNLISRVAQNNQVLRNAAIHNVRRIQVDRDFLAAKSADRKVV